MNKIIRPNGHPDYWYLKPAGEYSKHIISLTPSGIIYFRKESGKLDTKVFTVKTEMFNCYEKVIEKFSDMEEWSSEPNKVAIEHGGVYSRNGLFFVRVDFVEV